MLEDLGVSYAIIRPSLVYGDGDLLLNNVAWALRRSQSSSSMEGATTRFNRSTSRRLQLRRWRPVLSVGTPLPTQRGRTGSPSELLRLLASALGVRARLVHTSPGVSLALTQLADC